ncbi:XdhC/CoxI family protein [Nocardia yunnanensis]|uniref:XdhC/CoxI family protein n=1 Tax=Nocardia yunnanensis TaxID=2382165 RepID=A0A386ZEC8_9NOCA|nr:XdhC/CoxI family protein [Nocardia yunnanensis]AYF75880.1 XdhC/CoxI family protein [Nocardia yunnanensis]
MREVAAQLRDWNAADVRYAVATVVSVAGSAPLPAGTAMVVSADGEAVGSVSGGCVDGAVYELCLDALRTGRAARESFGYSDADAFAVGLTCGGTIEVAVAPGPVPAAGLAAIADGEPVAIAQLLGARGELVLVWPDRHLGTTGTPDLDAAVIARARDMLAADRTGIVRLPGPIATEVFVTAFRPPPRLLVFGVTDFAVALVRTGKLLGSHVTVCDARPVFATRARFPEADEVVVDWPHRYLADQSERGLLDERTVVCVLTHDARFDIPLLTLALRLPLAYVGAMGSRRTHHDRMRALRAGGVGDDELARLHSPIGLDLGARTPAETAVAIAAEFIAARRGGGAAPLRRTDHAIHATTPGAYTRAR